MIVTLTLGPGVIPELRFASSAEHGHRRFVVLSGEPRYAGTYKHWDLKLLKDGKPVERPSLLSIVLRETDGEATEGRISYVEAYEDAELGLREPTQFAFEAEYPAAAFDRLWSILSNTYGQLTVSISVKAPRTDFSGHEAIFEIAEGSDTWPTEGFYASRT